MHPRVCVGRGRAAVLRDLVLNYYLGSETISRCTVSELSEVAGHTGGVAENFLAWEKSPYIW